MIAKTIFLVSILLLCSFFTIEFIACQNINDPYESPSDGSLEKFKEMAGYSNWPGKNGPVRDGIDLSKCTISSLSDVPIVPNQAFYYSSRENGKIIPFNDVMWKKDKNNWVSIRLYFAETCADAHEYVIYQYFNSSNPMAPKADDPIIAGDISFFNARGFIRNNIYVMISVSHGSELNNRVAEIAKDIDELLLTRPTAASAEEFKPMIKRFEIANNLIEPWTQTQLFVEAYDPQGSELFYFWRVSAGSIGKDDFGQLYYFSSDEAAPGTTQTITLIVINGRGYFQKSSIEVRIKQN